MKHATPRTSQQPETNAHACVARYSEVVRGLNQRPSRKRRARLLPARRGRATITAEAACPQAGRTTWVAAHDRDPHRIVEAAGKDDTDQRRTAVTGDERKRRGPLAVGEQPCPPECLERLGKEKQQSGCYEQGWLAT
jgi:hypothetical protein